MAAIAQMADFVEDRHVYQILRQDGAHVAQIEAFFMRIADAPLALCAVHTVGRDGNTDCLAPEGNPCFKTIPDGVDIQLLDDLPDAFNVLYFDSYYDFVRRPGSAR